MLTFSRKQTLWHDSQINKVDTWFKLTGLLNLYKLNSSILYLYYYSFKYSSKSHCTKCSYSCITLQLTTHENNKMSRKQ